MMLLDVKDSPVTRFVQEAERRRIARELHDNVVQSLTALLTDLEYFRTRRLPANESASPEVVERLEAWQELARDSLLSMRQTLGSLRCSGDLQVELKASVESLVLELQQAGYIVIYECEDWPAVLPFEYSSNLYCIIRESLINVCKHAQASKINIFMFIHEESLHISIVDNGLGMLKPTAFASSHDGYHQGLIGMRERAALLGGQVSIESTPGKGTRVDVEVPWRE